MRLAVSLLVMLLVAGCASKDTPTPTPVGNNSTTSGGGTMAPPVAVAVALHNDAAVPPGVPPTTMGIDPSSLTLALGVPVNLTVTNGGTGAHNLVIDGMEVATDNLDPGEEVSVVFTPAQEGTFTMYCSIGGDSPLGHRGQGMVGSVTVS